MADVSNLLGRPYLGIVKAGGSASAVLTNGLLIPDSTLTKDSDVTELQQATLNTGTAVKLFEHVWNLRVPYSITLACTLRMFMSWIVNTAASLGGAPADCTGRWSVMVKRIKTDGTVADLETPVIEVYGTTRNLGNGTAGTTYNEKHIPIDIPANSLSAGEAIRVSLAFYIVQPLAGANLAVGLKCNPTIPADSVIFEFDVGSP